jgi:hypothetical protein
MCIFANIVARPLQVSGTKNDPVLKCAHIETDGEHICGPYSNGVVTADIYAARNTPFQ